ncbi:MAG: SDR family oxidoreductase [Pseudomonadota bacterium]
MAETGSHPGRDTTLRKKVLVVGATGVVGLAAMRRFARQGVETLAVSRRRPRQTYGAEHVALDLLDRDATKALAATHPDITHVVYAALYEQPGLIAGWLEAEQMATNERMLSNLLEPLLAGSGPLAHVTLLQGTKAYGAHVRPIDLPAREDRSEHVHDNFYWLQEAFIREQASGMPWCWTILRPQIIFGDATGVAMNLIPVLGAYGAVLRAEGAPLHFPGGEGGVLEAVDADLLAEVIDWAGSAAAAQDQIFNVTNGDVFAWRSVWPAIADALGMPVGEDRPMSVAALLANAAPTWRAIATEHELIEPDLERLLGESHHYADFTMAYGFDGGAPPPALVSTIKLRRAGFHGVIDTELMFRKWIAVLQQERLLPGRSGS